MTKRIADMTPEEAVQHRLRCRIQREKDREKRKAWNKAWKMANAEHVKSYAAKWNAKNRETELLRKRKRAREVYHADLEAARARWRDYYWSHRQQCLKTRARVARKMQRKLDAEVLSTATAAVPRGLPEREEIVANIVMAFYARKLRRADIAKRAPEFIRAHNRENDHFKTVSLNECLPGTDLARIDTITAEDLPW